MKTETVVEQTAEFKLTTPDASSFLRYPESWYYVCPSKSLDPGGILSVDLCGRALVAFRSMDGNAAVLERWCPHLGSNLAFGRIVGSEIECPYHHMRFAVDGSCAKQEMNARSFAVEERFGSIFAFIGDKPHFALPSFPDHPELVSAHPAHWTLHCPWYMVVANGFDARHFSHTHDRILIDSPDLAKHSAISMRIKYRYRICGDRLMDRITRLISGAVVEFELIAWGGNLALVRAKFGRDQSFGLVVVEPSYPAESTNKVAANVTVIVSALRRGNSASGRLRDRLVVLAKRFAIRRFMMDDARGLLQLHYSSSNLRPGDEALAAYLEWVSQLPSGSPELR